LACHLEVDPETALRSAITRFSGRFAHIERSLVAEGLTMAEADLDDLLARWSDAKRELEG
ncbi:MAG: nucleoside triphosphate pyrophosphohydrolase, partial [Actinomycetota bacterium]|nr:nucleoside triphosphate pyrophosphohydrolase [Actinomycetota bacterium]